MLYFCVNLVGLVMIVQARRITFKGHQVLRFHPRSDSQLEILDKLQQTENLKLDFWGEPSANKTIDIRVPPKYLESVKTAARASNISFDILIPDVQILLNIERKMSRQSIQRRRRNIFDGPSYMWYSVVGRYAKYKEISSWMKSVANNHSDIAAVIDIGKSFEGRPMTVLKLGKPQQGVVKPSIWIDGGMHAREWITPATAIYIVHTLVSHLNNTSISRLLGLFDWYFLPVANPDGYEYTHTTNRLWRKSRSRSSRSSRCVGVDINRNFGFHWLDCSSGNRFGRCGSRNPCRDTYVGRRPFSEPESANIAKFLKKIPSLALYLSLHSYSQLWLTNWGYTKYAVPDNGKALTLAKLGARSLARVYGTRYRVGSPAAILYEAGGSSYDWAKGRGGAKYSFTLELRDRGRYGFLLPSSEITPVGREVWTGIQTVAYQISNEILKHKH